MLKIFSALVLIWVLALSSIGNAYQYECEPTNKETIEKVVFGQGYIVLGVVGSKVTFEHYYTPFYSKKPRLDYYAVYSLGETFNKGTAVDGYKTLDFKHAIVVGDKPLEPVFLSPSILTGGDASSGEKVGKMALLESGSYDWFTCINIDRSTN